MSRSGWGGRDRDSSKESDGSSMQGNEFDLIKDLGAFFPSESSKNGELWVPQEKMLKVL